MSLQLIVDTLEGLAEPVAALYAKGEDGKFKLGVDGVPDVTNLQKALRAERDARAAADRIAKDFEGLDATEVRNMLKQMEGNEEAQLLKAGKIDDVIARRTQKLVQENERKLKEAMDKVSAESSRAQKLIAKVLDGAVTAAASKAGLHPQAIDDAMLHARAIFSLDDGGNAVQMGEDGKPVLGKDGKTPFTPAEWLESMREQKPHWFPATANGGGARNSSGTPRQDLSKLSPVERMNIARQQGAR
jgi:ribosomal protein L22